MPEHLLSHVPRVAMRTAVYNDAPIGNGPFRFVSRVRGSRWTFTRNAQFPATLGGPPLLAGFTVAIVDEATTKFAGLASGELDVAGISPTMASLVRRDGTLTLLSYPVLFGSALCFNTTRPPFSDALVRRAVARAIDRPRIAEIALAGFARATSSAVPPDNALWWRGAEPLNVKESDALLDQAGWLRSASGQRVKDGIPFEVTLLTVGSGDNVAEQLIQSDLGARGITMKVRQIEMGAFLTTARSRNKQFDMLIAGIPGDLSLSYITSMFASGQRGGALDYTGFHSPALDVLLERATAAPAGAAAIDAWRAVQSALDSLEPATWLYHSPRRAGNFTPGRRGADGSSRRARDVARLAAFTAPHAMTLLLSATVLRERPAHLGTDLRALASGLRREIAPLISSIPELPADKALLSKAGGRCAIDGALLGFDPYDSRHLCPACYREYSGPEHDRFRLYWYQLWLAERTLHASVLGIVTDDEECRRTAMALLEQYAEQYLRYPNFDNVLGPSRPFFSTYLESIWLLQLCIAVDVLESGSDAPTMRTIGARVRERVIAPSASLIGSYDEGMSNRQVWNNAALMAAARLLGDTAMFDRALHGPSGVHAHLAEALLSDGTWYEGENYHLFAHRGLWYGTQLAETAGAVVPHALAERMQEGFAAPFRSVLPDLTYPARRDSQYAISIRQPRFAESCELGLARADDERLGSMLARLYDPAVPRTATGRRESAADVERNLSATGLCRADLSWRTLLFARPSLPSAAIVPLRSDLLPAQGLAILRRSEHDIYVSLDYGHSGGGHGHPDRLNLTLCRGDDRLFDDPGTDSYVDRSLHWYRSTLAHNAPLIDGRSQPRVGGTLLAFDDQGDAGWVSAIVGFLPGLTVRRTLIVMQGYLIDEVEWTSDNEHEITLPMHGVRIPKRDQLSAEVARSQLLRERGEHALANAPGALPVGGRWVHGSDPEDGFSFLKEVEWMTSVTAPSAKPVYAVTDPGSLRGYLFAEPGTELYSANAPAAPGVGGNIPMILARHAACTGRFTAVWDWSSSVAGVTRAPSEIIVELLSAAAEPSPAQTVHRHRRNESEWIIGQHDPAGRTITRTLGGVVATSALPGELEGRAAHAPGLPAALSDVLSKKTSAIALPAKFTLGRPHYRPSELTWLDAGMPTATIRVSSAGTQAVIVTVLVPHSSRLFIPLETENELDNEPASINGDSVQLYASYGAHNGGWLLVPGGREVGIRPVAGWANDMSVTSVWEPSGAGYRLDAMLVLDPGTRELLIDVIVNDMAPGRARRRGQLVLSGALGEFVYLRGDRHDPSRLLRFSLPNV